MIVMAPHSGGRVPVILFSSRSLQQQKAVQYPGHLLYYGRLSMNLHASRIQLLQAGGGVDTVLPRVKVLCKV
jgi:hypothetical protein